MPMTTYVGDTGTPFKFTLSLSDGTHPDVTGFTGTNFTLHLYNGTTVKNCSTGTWSVIDGVGGQCQYQPEETDIDTPGDWQVYLSLLLSNGPKTFTPDTIKILVKF